jgi:hypothetical protein
MTDKLPMKYVPEDPRFAPPPVQKPTSFPHVNFKILDLQHNMLPFNSQNFLIDGAGN